MILQMRWQSLLLISHVGGMLYMLARIVNPFAAADCAVVGSAAVIPAVSASHLWKHMLMPKQIWSTQNITPMENLVRSNVNQQLCTTQTIEQVDTGCCKCV
jgi:hypothetical protein